MIPFSVPANHPRLPSDTEALGDTAEDAAPG